MLDSRERPLDRLANSSSLTTTCLEYTLMLLLHCLQSSRKPILHCISELADIFVRNWLCLRLLKRSNVYITVNFGNVAEFQEIHYYQSIQFIRIDESMYCTF